MSTSIDGGNKRKNFWLISAASTLLILSIFWSVDSSVVYVCLGIALFCFFQYFRFESNTYAKPGQKKYNPVPATETSTRIEDLIEEIQKGFASSGQNQQLKTYLQRIVFFVIVFFL